jgi:hypothetical protein
VFFRKQKQLWSQFRTTQAAQSLPSEEPYISLCVDCFNCLLEDSPKAADFWFRVKCDVIDYFGKTSLEPWELSSEYDLRRHCKVGVLVRRIAFRCGIVLSSDATCALDEGQLGRFVAADIIALQPLVKCMNVVELSSAIALSMQALTALPREQERLFALAYRKFDSASSASPSNLTTSKYWALSLLSHAEICESSARHAQACVLLQEADARFRDLGTVEKEREKLFFFFL